MPIKHSGTWIPKAETAEKTIALSKIIADSYSEQGLPLPQPVFLARSGLEIAGTMCRFWGLKASQLHVAGVEKNEVGNDQGLPTFRIGQFPSESDIAGQHVIAVDVVCRSGRTMEFVTNKLAELGAASVKSAVLYDMTGATKDNDENYYKPDFCAHNGRGLGYAIFHWEWDNISAMAGIIKV